MGVQSSLLMFHNNYTSERNQNNKQKYNCIEPKNEAKKKGKRQVETHDMMSFISECEVVMYSEVVVWRNLIVWRRLVMD